MDTSYSPDRASRLRVWKRNREITDGADTVKANARSYVLKHSKLGDQDYDAIMSGTEFFPMAARTLQSFIGLVFRKDPLFDGSALFPTAISSDGHTADEFQRLLMREYMIVNDGGVLIDAPTTPEGAKVGEVEKMELYSYQAFYPAESIREIIFKSIDGKKKLVYVRLVEDDDNGRELFLIDGVYQCRIWKRHKEAKQKFKKQTYRWEMEDITPKVAESTLGEIPFVWLSDGDTGASMDDLCATNVIHFGKAFLLSQAAAWIASPVMVIAGVTKEDQVELDLSPGSFFAFEDPTTKWGFLEYKGDGVPLIERELDRLEQHGSMLGSRMLIQEKSVSEAEGTVARRQAGENSILASMAKHVSSRSTRAFQMQADMMRKDSSGVRYSLSTDFVPNIMEPQLVAQLLALNVAGKLPDEALFEALQKGEVIHESWDYETYQASLDVQRGTNPAGQID